MFISFLFCKLLLYTVEYSHRNRIYKITVNDDRNQLNYKGICEVGHWELKYLLVTLALLFAIK